MGFRNESVVHACLRLWKDQSPYLAHGTLRDGDETVQWTPYYTIAFQVTCLSSYSALNAFREARVPPLDSGQTCTA